MDVRVLTDYLPSHALENREGWVRRKFVEEPGRGLDCAQEPTNSAFMRRVSCAGGLAITQDHHSTSNPVSRQALATVTYQSRASISLPQG